MVVLDLRASAFVARTYALTSNWNERRLWRRYARQCDAAARTLERINP